MALARPLIAATCGIGLLALAPGGFAAVALAQQLRGMQDERGSSAVPSRDNWQSKRVRPAKSTKAKPPPKPVIRQAGDPLPAEAPPVLKALPPPDPAPAPRLRKPERMDPYEPLGLRLGSITVLPWFEQSLGYDSNPNRVANVQQGSAVSKTELGFTAKSDWSVHQLDASLRGAYFVYPDTPSADRPDGDASIRLRLDATRDVALAFGANASVSTQQPGTVEQPLVGTQRGLIYGTGADAAIIRSVGPVVATLKGTVQRFTYGDLEVGNGLPVSQSFRNYDDAGLSLRIGYDVQPGFRPFVEAQVDRRTYDQAALDPGLDRDTDGLVGRIGVALDITRVVHGEASVGYGERQPDGALLAPLRGPLFDASIIWTPTPLTTVKFTANNSLGDITAASTAGSKTQSFGVEVQHALRRNVTLTGFVTAARTSYESSGTDEDGITAGLKLDYKLSRALVLRTSFTHERLKSSAPDSDYTANVFLVGLRLQR